MNTRRLLICLLSVACVVTPSATLPLRAQSAQQRMDMERRRREMERTRREFQRKSEQKQREMKRAYDRSSNDHSQSSSGAERSQPQSTAPKYVFRNGQTLAYGIEINSRDELGARYWAGVILLTTREPTPVSSDGTAQGSAKVAVWGHLEAYYKVGDKLERDPSEDIKFPETLSFATTGIGRGKCPDLPCHMHLRFRLLDGIFPRVPSTATNERSQRKREFMVQTTYGGIPTGYDSTIVGTVDIVQRASGNTATLVENYAGSNDVGTQKVSYVAQQTGSFSSSGALQRSQTSFEFNWRSKDRVDISVSQIPADQVIAAFSLAEP